MIDAVECIIPKRVKMTVLTILGILVLAALLYVLVLFINKFTEQKYEYTFFNITNFALVTIGYTFIYFGNSWYKSALSTNADLLNGELIMVFGVMFVLSALIYNVKKTSLFAGIGLTLFQYMIYLPLAYLSFLALLVAIGFAAQTKPVYTINK